MTKMAEISQNRYPIYDQNGWKTLSFGAAHTYIAHIREYPPPPRVMEQQHLQSLAHLQVYKYVYKYSK